MKTKQCRAASTITFFCYAPTENPLSLKLDPSIKEKVPCHGSGKIRPSCARCIYVDYKVPGEIRWD